MFAAADTPAELVELGQSETVSVFNKHYRRVGNINADFHDRSSD